MGKLMEIERCLGNLSSRQKQNGIIVHLEWAVAKIKRLQMALKPFAAVAKDIPAGVLGPERTRVDFITVAEYREAAEAAGGE